MDREVFLFNILKCLSFNSAFFPIPYSTQPLLDLVSTQGIFFNARGVEGKEHAVNKSAVQKLS